MFSTVLETEDNAEPDFRIAPAYPARNQEKPLGRCSYNRALTGPREVPLQSMDIEERRRTEALLAGEKRLLELISTGSPLALVLEQLCLLMEDTAEGCRCSVLLVDPRGSTLQHGAAPSLPAGVIQAIDGRTVESCWGPCAVAVRYQEQLIVPDIARDERWRDGEWARLAAAAGLRSCWTTPIVGGDGRTLGAFASAGVSTARAAEDVS